MKDISTPSLDVTEQQSAAVQKTPNRVSLDSMKARIERTEVLHPEYAPHMTICILYIENGYMLIGRSAPADPKNYDQKLGEQYAYEDAFRQMWALEAYLVRESMWDGER